MENTKQKVSEIQEGEITYGSSNVFADMGLPNPAQRLAKAKLASTINEFIQGRGLTQKQAAAIMGIDQPKVSKIIRGQLKEFSTEWLLSRILHLGLDVDIVIHTEKAKKFEGSINVACI